jgi:hypothetical protein
LNSLSLAPAVRERIEIQRPKLAAIQTDDARVREAVDESFVLGYRAVVRIAAILGILSSLSAITLIDNRR